MHVAIIVAMTKKRVIGINNKMPWHIREELKNFRKITEGNTVIMGRKTFESIGKPLPNRNNIVLSRSIGQIKGAEVCKSLEEALEKAKSHGADIFIIGGESVYGQSIKLVEKLYVSYIKEDHKGNKFFPKFNLDEWRIESKKDFSKFEYFVYVKKKK